MEIVARQKVCRCGGNYKTARRGGRDEQICRDCGGPYSGKALKLTLKCGHEVIAPDGYRELSVMCQICDAAEQLRVKSMQRSPDRKRRRAFPF